MDPREVIDELLTGKQIQENEYENHELLIVCEQALGEGHDEIVQSILPYLNSSQSAIIQFRQAQMENNADLAQQFLAQALEDSRSKDQRDHMLEARIRMEWGVLRASLGEFEQAGVDLRWALERMGAIDEGHRWHGLSLLNMAAWHRNRGESGMALAMHAEISRHGPHLVEIVATSRRRAAEILIEKKHIYSAIRNFWIAHQGFRQTNMLDEAIEAGLHWIDIGLIEVSDSAPTMEEAVKQASPRSAGEPKPRVWINTQDLGMMVDWLKPHVHDADSIAVLADAQSALQG